MKSVCQKGGLEDANAKIYSEKKPYRCVDCDRTFKFMGDLYIMQSTKERNPMCALHAREGTWGGVSLTPVFRNS